MGGAASGSWVRRLRWPLSSQLVSPVASSIYVLTVLLIESESFSELTRRGLEGVGTRGGGSMLAMRVQEDPGECTFQGASSTLAGGSVVGVPSHVPKGCGFHSWSGPISRWWVQSRVRARMRNNQSTFPSHIDDSLSLCL